MSIVNITDVRCLNPPVCPAATPFEFQVTLEVTAPLQADLEWKMVYVGNALDETKDQQLDAIELGPLEVAAMQFVFSAPAPNLFLVAREDQLDVSAVFLSASYKGHEFCRIGYYTKHEYPEGSFPIDPVTGQEQIPENLEISRLLRKIDSANPRVTRFLINWDNPNVELEPPAPTYAMEDDDMDMEEEDDDDEDDESEDDGGDDEVEVEGDVSSEEQEMDENNAKFEVPEHQQQQQFFRA